MAITLSTATSAMLARLVDQLMGEDEPVGPTTRSSIPESVVVTNPNTTSKCTVTNGYLYEPKGGTILIGSSTYHYIRCTVEHGNQPPHWNGRGTPPKGVLHLRGATYGSHAAGSVVSMPNTIAQVGRGNIQSGGVIYGKFFSAFLKLIQNDLAPAGSLTVSGPGAADGSTVVDAGAYTAGAEVGNMVTIVSNGVGAVPSPAYSYVASNTTGALTVYPLFSTQILAAAVYTITPAFLDTYIDALDAQVPTHEPASSDDIAHNPQSLAVAALAPLMRLIYQLGGSVSVPLAEALYKADLAEGYYPPMTALVKPALTGEYDIYVADASIFLNTTQVYLPVVGGTTVYTIARNYQKKNGAGINRLTFTAALSGDALLPFLAVAYGATALTGVQAKAPAPYASGISFWKYLEAAKDAVEAHTVPV